MTPEKLQHANALNRTITFLRQAIAAVETLIGLTADAKAALKGEIQKHHDAAQEQLSSL